MPEGEATETTDTTETRDVSTEETPDKLKTALESERKLKREAERELKELRKFKQEQEQTRLTEAEKLAARERTVADQEARITARLRASILRDEIGTAVTAEKLTLNAPIGDVLRLMDADAVEWDGETPKNVRALLRDLVKDRPYLANRRSGSADGGAGGDQAGYQDMNALIRKAAGRP